MLTRLIYFSKTVEGFGEEDMESILEASRRNNARVGVTGFLCFNANYFLQALEGSRTAVNETYRRIAGDPRHAEPVLLETAEIAARTFAHWSMGYVPRSSMSEDLLLKYSERLDFDPTGMRAQGALGLLTELDRLARSWTEA